MMKMYVKRDKQISLYDFGEKAGMQLNPENRWVKMSELIDWDAVEEEHIHKYSLENGAAAKPIRLAIGSMIIQRIEDLTDEKLVQHIQENPYMQYFCGFNEYSGEIPFVPSLLVEFRKRFGTYEMWHLNEMLFRRKEVAVTTEDDKTVPPNKGILILDATCTPANIKYPQDINLCNEAREKSEEFVETMHKGNRGKKAKPRLDKEKAKKEYKKVAKSKNRSSKTMRKAIKKQLSYLRRNLDYIEKLKADGHYDLLTDRQKETLETIKKLYSQQKYMIDNRTHSVPDRIVSISQPHVRPIVRGKAGFRTEFGAKVAIAVIDGYAFVTNISWNPYNEGGDLIEQIEDYKLVYGHYPEAVIVDKIYRTKDNIKYCTSLNIRISGPKLGRPKKGADSAADREQAYKDSGIRNIVENKFGIGKIAYGLRRIMTKLQDTSETVIYLAFLAMNLVRRLLSFLHFIPLFRFGFYLLTF
jgi:hypothetical protein